MLKKQPRQRRKSAILTFIAATGICLFFILHGSLFASSKVPITLHRIEPISYEKEISAVENSITSDIKKAAPYRHIMYLD